MDGRGPAPGSRIPAGGTSDEVSGVVLLQARLHDQVTRPSCRGHTEGAGRSRAEKGARCDPLRGLPLCPAEMVSSRLGAPFCRARSREYFDLSPEVRAYLTIFLVEALSMGNVAPLQAAPPGGREGLWRAVGATQRDVSRRVGAAHVASPPSADRPRGSPPILEGSRSAASGAARLAPLGKGPILKELRRGDVCRAVVGHASLPPKGAALALISALSPRVKTYLDLFLESMLRREREAGMSGTGVTQYIDSAIRSMKTMDKLGLRLWKSSQLTWFRSAKAHFAQFTVVMRFLVEPSKSLGDVVQRSVLGPRGAKGFWQSPPWTPTASAFRFRHVDLAPGTIGERRICGMTVDLPDWHHTSASPSSSRSSRRVAWFMRWRGCRTYRRSRR